MEKNLTKNFDNQKLVPENNFDLVERETCTSSPMTDSHFIVSPQNLAKVSFCANRFLFDICVQHLIASLQRSLCQ